MDISESIRLRRVSLRITQAELSKKTGLKQPTISAIEKGVNKPALDTIILISDALGCTVSDLIGQTHPKDTSLSNGEKMLIKIYRQLNQTGQSFLYKQAEMILSQDTFRKDAYTQSVG